MNENLSDTEDGTITTYTSLGGLKGVATEFEKTGRIYYPFVIDGKTGDYSILHLPTGMSLDNNGYYTWPTLKKTIAVIDEMRKVDGCDSVDILGTDAVASFAGIIRDHLGK